jgi:DNA-binding NarL/FixJ family response regulator
MQSENGSKAGEEKSCQFGVMAEILRNLQKEEMELTETCQAEVLETSQTEKSLELIAEINSTLKEISKTQKEILEEIKKGKNQS